MLVSPSARQVALEGEGADSQGVLWWAGGLLGIFLSRGGKRSFVPAVM
jgi:hypothetical protein